MYRLSPVLSIVNLSENTAARSESQEQTAESSEQPTGRSRRAVAPAPGCCADLLGWSRSAHTADGALMITSWLRFVLVPAVPSPRDIRLGVRARRRVPRPRGRMQLEPERTDCGILRYHHTPRACGLMLLARPASVPAASLLIPHLLYPSAHAPSWLLL